MPKLEGKHYGSKEIIYGEGVKGDAKGKFGNNLEKLYFGYSGNSSHNPDLSEIGVEIKSTGMKRDAKPLERGYFAAKERISLAIIDFPNIANQSFEDSVWDKIKKPLFILYDYESKDIRNFDKKIIKVDFYEYSDYEKEMIYLEEEN